MADRIGWDIGGAHVKAARLDGEGRVLALAQEACPLWRGLAELERAVPAVLAQLQAEPSAVHAVTMTGELVDAFAGRDEGVREILAALRCLLGTAAIVVYAGPQGLPALERLQPAQYPAVASANWLASAACVAAQLPEALFVDLGSTTCDILPLKDGVAHYRGYSDFERLRQEELVYTGVVRTPLMALAEQAPFDGDMILLAAEHFATTADIYRLLGCLPEHADAWPAADNGEKTAAGSARRLARLLGRDSSGGDLAAWRRVAAYLAECQLGKIQRACLRQLSRGLLEDGAPLVGAGVGRFLLQRLAARLQRPYLDVGEVLAAGAAQPGPLSVADVAPAVAVAKLAQRILP